MGGIVFLPVALDPPIKQHMGLRELADIAAEGFEAHTVVANASVEVTNPLAEGPEPTIDRVQPQVDPVKSSTHLLAEGLRSFVHG